VNRAALPRRTRGMRVILADDSALFRGGLARLLTAVGVEVSDEVGDAAALLGAVAADPPDAVIVDIRMPPTFLDEGLVAAETLRRTHPGVAVLLLSTHVETTLALRLLENRRPVGYLLKDRVADVHALRDALARLVDGQSAIDPEVVDGLLALRSRRDALTRLSARERAVLRAMAQGRSNANIAEALDVGERTVENYATRIFAKLDLEPDHDVNRRVQAVLLWLGGRPGDHDVARVTEQ
jgi:DNA-binding NarL/FixJ family response regulator